MKKIAAVGLLALVVAATATTGAAGCAARELRTPVGDEVLKARVEAALASASDVNADRITVDASDGVVTLTGQVASGTEQQSVGAIVRALPGVAEVSFSLRIGPPDSGGRE